MAPRWHFRALVLGMVWVSGVSGEEAARVQSDFPSFQKTVQPFLAKYCLECHDETASGDVRLDEWASEEALVKGMGVIEEAGSMLRKHAMPPKRKAQPGEGESKDVLAWIDAFIARMDKTLPPNPAKVVIRRLNRSEYDNTVRDLLGVTFKPAEDFPPDDSGYGFDNIGATLSMNPTLMEKYLAAAEKVARTAVFGVEATQPERVAHEPFFTADAFSRNKEVKSEYDETGLSLASALHVTQRFAATGEYKLRTIMRGSRPQGANPAEIGFWIDGKLVHEGKVTPPRSGEMNGQWVEIKVPISAGEHWLAVSILRAFEGLPKAYKGPKPSEAEGTTRTGVDAWFPMYLDVVGPYEPVKGASEESLKRVFTCGHSREGHDASCAKNIVADLARRAYRRPVTDEEVSELTKLVEMVRKDGDSFEEGVCLAIQRMLISPHFLFRVEKAPKGEDGKDVHPIRQHELASRLSYFLWGSMPDEELLTCADEQRLREPAVLETQVKRMLDDPKAGALVENFGGQWLLTRALESHTPDRTKFTEFTDYTRMSMKQETDSFFAHLIREDRSILEFLDADYTFLNQRMAEFYGIPGVTGHEFRKVDLKGTPRGGVFTQASVLTVSSYANRTSPVLRGKWILENLLNAPPPPPPNDVPSLDEKEIGTTVSLREQLEKHRANATCASCHSRMDPLGFALEHFDAIGRWRETDGKFAIETAGVLPDGRSFADHAELRKILRDDPRSFTECVAEKMLIYALGRGLEPSDRTAIRAIAEHAAKNEHRFSAVVMGVVRSVPFQMQKSAPQAKATASDGAPHVSSGGSGNASAGGQP